MPRRAFTLVELLVVIAIIGLLSSVAVVTTSSAGINARNQKRKSDLTQIVKALELYNINYGSYPSTAGAWWGSCNGGGWFILKDDTGPNGWIPNLAPSYIGILPRDPNTDPTTSECYAYRSNGIDYKVLVHATPEGVMSAADPFYDPPRPTWAWSAYTPDARSW